MRLIRTSLPLAGALLTGTLVIAGCGGAPHVPPPKPPASAVEHFVPAIPRARSLPKPPASTFEETGGDTAMDRLARMIDGPERTWVCRMIDLGIAVGDMRLSPDDFGAYAIQEGVGLAKPLRRQQAQAYVEELINGDPSALKDLACI